MRYILIWFAVMSNGGGVTSGSAVFENIKACQAAKFAVALPAAEANLSAAKAARTSYFAVTAKCYSENTGYTDDAQNK